MPAITSAPVTSALVTPTLATSPARRCWSPALRPASGRHLHWPTPRRNAASRCIPIQVGENLAETIRNGGGEVFPVWGDFSIAADVERVVEDSAQHFGRLDGLVNNAASAACLMPNWPRRITDADLNARSVLAASRKAMPWLKRQGGFIVNTSIAARNGAGGGAGLYGSAKARQRGGAGHHRDPFP